jgi:hypothetical protein
LFGVALLPGIVTGVAAMLAPRYVPQMGLGQELRLIVDGRDPLAVIRKQSYPQNRRGSNSATQESGGRLQTVSGLRRVSAKARRQIVTWQNHSCGAIFFMCRLLNSQCL